MIVTKVVVGLLIVVLAVVLTTRVIVCSPAGKKASFDLENARFKLENALRSEHVCGEPQPRVLYLHDIVSNETWNRDYINNTKFVRPYGVVLHRCENSGCCREYNERCQAAHEETVTLSFMVIRSHGGTSGLVFRDHEAQNHTKCTCRKIDDSLIKK